MEGLPQEDCSNKKRYFILILLGVLLAVDITLFIFYHSLKPSTFQRANGQVSQETDEELLLKKAKDFLALMEAGRCEEAVDYIAYDKKPGLTREEISNMLNLIESSYFKKSNLSFKISSLGVGDNSNIGLVEVEFVGGSKHSIMNLHFSKENGDWKIVNILFQGDFLLE